jgi:ABC-2 type transport system permease protein
MRDTGTVALAIAKRSVILVLKNPALFLPMIVFPLFFLVAFAGGLSNVSNVPGFDFPTGYTAFQFVFVFLQSACFGGVFTGFGVAADFENGFARRLVLGAPRRTGIVIGYVIAALIRFSMTAVIVTAAALATGMQIDGNAVDLVGLIGLALIINAAAALWAIGLALRTKTLQAGPLMQVPIFITLFLAPVYVPLTLLKGWIHAVASVNPATALLNAGRGFISGVPHHSALAFAVAAGLLAGFALWSTRGMRRVERGL